MRLNDEMPWNSREYEHIPLFEEYEDVPLSEDIPLFEEYGEPRGSSEKLNRKN